MTIRTRLTLMAAAMAALTIASVLILFTTGNIIIATARDSEAHARQVAAERVRLALAIGDQAASVRQFILSVDERDAQRLDAAIEAEAEAALALADDPHLPAAVRPAVDRLRDAVRDWRDVYVAPAIAAVRGGKAEAARSVAAVNRDRDHYATVQARLDALNELLVARPSTGLAELELVSGIRLVMFILSIVGGIVAFLVSVRALRSLVSEPLAQLVRTAHAVEHGEPATFRLRRRDEIGDLAGSLERMRHVIDEGRRQADALAGEASIVNHFTELTAFTETDVAVAEALVTAIHELVAPDAAMVHLTNRSQDRANPVAVVGAAQPKALALHQLDVCPGIRRGSIYVTSDAGRALAVRCPIAHVATGTVVCLPLIALGETVGAVHLHWERVDALPLDLRATLSRLGEHTALSIGNRRLVQALQGMADTDARTGLANSRAFDTLVEGRVQARARGTSDAVLMFDLDHFKAFNDRYGHPAGDEALRAFAAILRDTLREDDVVARYGGEEFVAYLPGLDRAAAAEVAERVRSRTASSIVAIGPGQTARITVSVGVAVGPEDGSDRASLLRAADQRLYEAKAAGRDRVAGGPPEAPATASARRSTTRGR